VQRRVWPYGIASLVCCAGLIALAWYGYDTSLDIRGGTALNASTNPSKPGDEARVRPTPTHLVVPTTSDGRIEDLELVVEGSKSGGAVVFVPALMVVTVNDAPTNLRDLAAERGIPKLVEVLQDTLGIGITDAVEVDPEQLAQLFGSAGAIEIDNPDALRVDGEVAFPAGAVRLEADQVAHYLSIVNDGEAVVNRPFRAQQVWQAWLGKLASSPAPTLAGLPAVVGDGSLDLSGLMARVAAGHVNYQQLPVDRLAVPNQGGFAIYQPNRGAIDELMAEVVPFPGSAYPGQRARVRLLNGTRNAAATLRAAQPIVAAGGQIVVIGNAAKFGLATTTVEYNAESQKAAAQAIAKKLGIATASPGVESDAADVTVTVGADAR